MVIRSNNHFQRNNIHIRNFNDNKIYTYAYIYRQALCQCVCYTHRRSHLKCIPQTLLSLVLIDTASLWKNHFINSKKYFRQREKFQSIRNLLFIKNPSSNICKYRTCDSQHNSQLLLTTLLLRQRVVSKQQSFFFLFLLLLFYQILSQSIAFQTTNLLKSYVFNRIMDSIKI